MKIKKNHVQGDQATCICVKWTTTYLRWWSHKSSQQW